VVEIVNLTVTAVGPMDLTLPRPVSRPAESPPSLRQVRFDDGGAKETLVHRREALAVGAGLAGPAIIEEPDATTLLEPGDRLTVEENGALLIAVS
jgi:N-methylhydantoinase A/oxoprolinase/acetone carboxylase beta subunit